MLDKMSSFEHSLKEMTSKLSKLNLIEFYHEENEIKNEIHKLDSGLSVFNLYLPSSRLIVKDVTLMQS